MGWIVDGDNVLGERHRDDAAKRRLTAEIGRALAGIRVEIFYDGPPPDHPHPAAPGHRVRFAGGVADPAIESFVAALGDPRAWTLVTSDRSLGDRCRHRGVRVIRPRQLWQRLRGSGGGAAPDKPNGPVDIKEWEEFFGIGRGDASGG